MTCNGCPMRASVFFAFCTDIIYIIYQILYDIYTICFELKCPYCLSEIAIEATRCPHCTSVLDENN